MVTRGILTTLILIIPGLEVSLQLLVAQTDPISGGAGWVGAGLLGLVLGWLLLKHLPDKDKHLERIIDKHLEAELQQRENHSALEREQRVEFRTALELILTHSRSQIEGIGTALGTDLNQLRNSVEEVSALVHEVANKRGNQ